MGCDRDRALLEFYVSSGARAGELLGIGLEDIDWPGQLVYVISKGNRVRQPVPASPNAFRYLGSYLAVDGLPDPGQPVWRTRRGDPRPLTYWAMRRILQRANDRLGTNWTLHDARHTAAARMVMGRVASDASFRRNRECVWPAVLFTAGQAAAGRAMW